MNHSLSEVRKARKQAYDRARYYVQSNLGFSTLGEAGIKLPSVGKDMTKAQLNYMYKYFEGLKKPPKTEPGKRGRRPSNPLQAFIEGHYNPKGAKLPKGLEPPHVEKPKPKKTRQQKPPKPPQQPQPEEWEDETAPEFVDLIELRLDYLSEQYGYDFAQAVRSRIDGLLRMGVSPDDLESAMDSEFWDEIDETGRYVSSLQEQGKHSYAITYRDSALDSAFSMLSGSFGIFLSKPADQPTEHTEDEGGMMISPDDEFEDPFGLF